MKFIAGFLLSIIAANFSNATTQKPPQQKYKATKEMSFENHVVEGQIYRPDLSVVTGDTALGGLSVLRLRTDLRDLVKQQAGEVVK
jgi:hypothetical protein